MEFPVWTSQDVLEFHWGCLPGITLFVCDCGFVLLRGYFVADKFADVRKRRHLPIVFIAFHLVCLLYQSVTRPPRSRNCWEAQLAVPQRICCRLPYTRIYWLWDIMFFFLIRGSRILLMNQWNWKTEHLSYVYWKTFVWNYNKTCGAVFRIWVVDIVTT
jgi:hypothetical protein